MVLFDVYSHFLLAMLPLEEFDAAERVDEAETNETENNQDSPYESVIIFDDHLACSNQSLVFWNVWFFLHAIAAGFI